MSDNTETTVDDLEENVTEEVTAETTEEVVIDETEVVTEEDESNPKMTPDGKVDGPALGLVDIKNAVAVIDYAAEQGAFKGWGTINQVIAVRQKLSSFIDAATPQDVKDAEAKAVTDKAEADKAEADTIVTEETAA